MNHPLFDDQTTEKNKGRETARGPESLTAQAATRGNKGGKATHPGTQHNGGTIGSDQETNEQDQPF